MRALIRTAPSIVLLLTLAQQLCPNAYAESNPVLVFRVELNELYPKMRVVPPGTYMVRVLNGLISAPLTIQLDRENGQRLTEKKMRKGESATEELIKLTPGKHTIRVGGTPEWAATVEVTTPKK